MSVVSMGIDMMHVETLYCKLCTKEKGRENLTSSDRRVPLSLSPVPTSIQTSCSVFLTYSLQKTLPNILHLLCTWC